MRAFLDQILGSYQPVTYEVYNEVLQAYEEVIPAGLAGVDWSFVISGLAFVVVVYCTLKLLGGVICKIS